MAAPDHGPRGNKRSKPREQVASSMDEDGALSLTSNRPIRKDFLQIRTRFKASSTSGDKGDDLGNALGKPCQMGQLEQRRWRTDGGGRMVADGWWRLKNGSETLRERSVPRVSQKPHHPRKSEQASVSPGLAQWTRVSSTAPRGCRTTR